MIFFIIVWNFSHKILHLSKSSELYVNQWRKISLIRYIYTFSYQNYRRSTSRDVRIARCANRPSWQQTAARSREPRGCATQIARYNDKQLIRSVTWTSRNARIARHDYGQLIRSVTWAVLPLVGIWLCGMSRKLIVSIYERMTYRMVAYKAIESLSNFASLFDMHTHL